MSDGRCAICARAPAQFGVLCVDCRDELVGPGSITPEQIQSYGLMDSTAALIDVWGGVRMLAHEVIIGRTIDPPAVSIIDSAISRQHAKLWRTDDGWRVQDLGSTNKTYVEATAADRPTAIRTKQQLRLGYIAFYFLEDARAFAAATPPTLSGRTVRADTKTRTVDPVPVVVDLPPVSLELQQPTGGGVGIAIIEGKRLELTLPQYELIVLLVKRMITSAHEDVATRGFVRPTELANVLSLEAPKPDEDNIRQLVRRVRRACERAGIRDLIENRYGMGYRLTITPRLRG